MFSKTQFPNCSRRRDGINNLNVKSRRATSREHNGPSRARARGGSARADSSPLARSLARSVAAGREKNSTAARVVERVRKRRKKSKKERDTAHENKERGKEKKRKGTRSELTGNDVSRGKRTGSEISRSGGGPESGIQSAHNSPVRPRLRTTTTMMMMLTLQLLLLLLLLLSVLLLCTYARSDHAHTRARTHMYTYGAAVHRVITSISYLENSIGRSIQVTGNRASHVTPQHYTPRVPRGGDTRCGVSRCILLIRFLLLLFFAYSAHTPPSSSRSFFLSLSRSRAHATPSCAFLLYYYSSPSPPLLPLVRRLVAVFRFLRVLLPLFLFFRRAHCTAHCHTRPRALSRGTARTHA